MSNVLRSFFPSIGFIWVVSCLVNVYVDNTGFSTSTHLSLLSFMPANLVCIMLFKVPIKRSMSGAGDKEMMCLILFEFNTLMNSFG